MLETGEPAPSASDKALMLLAGACVTSLMLMLSPGGSGWWCCVESGDPWKMSGQMSAGCGNDVLCSGWQD